MTRIQVGQAARGCCIRVVAVASLLAAQSVFSAEIGESAAKSLNLKVESPAAVIADDAVITDAEIRGFLASVPEDRQANFLADARRFAESLQGMADTEQLALAAIDAGILDDTAVSAQLYTQAARTLVNKHLEQVVRSRALDDYTQLARELYLAKPEQFKGKPTYTFTHLLIETNDRSESEAMRKLIALLDELDSGTSFEELVKRHSESSTVDEDGGRFESVTLDSLQRNFASALRAIDDPGTISEPVRSRLGWHLIRLERVDEGELLSWDEAKDKALEMARQRHAEKIRDNYTSEVVDVSQIEIAPNLVERYQEEYGASGQ